MLIDLDHRMALAYTMNKMAPELMGDVRARNIAVGADMALATA